MPPTVVDTVPAPAQPSLPCPCGRAHPLVECCLPVAQQLRRSGGDHPQPFDEIRATSALLLWGLLAREQPASPLVTALSLAARRFWGPVLAATFSPDAPHAPISSGAPMPAADPEYGCRLFERTWGAADPASRSWLHATLPVFVCADTVLGELALDWLLWDHPWMRGRPAAHWTAQTASMSGHRRVRRTTDAILRSRLGLWRLDEAIPRRGFRLTDRLTGDRTLLHTASDPWPDPDERLMLARIYCFGDWRLLAGRCLLLDPVAVDALLTALHTRALALQAPPAQDPRWRPWLKAELAPLVAAQWLSTRLAPPPPDRYHGTYC